MKRQFHPWLEIGTACVIAELFFFLVFPTLGINRETLKAQGLLRAHESVTSRVSRYLV